MTRGQRGKDNFRQGHLFFELPLSPRARGIKGEHAAQQNTPHASPGALKDSLHTARNRLVLTVMMFAVCFVVLGGRLIEVGIAGLEQPEAVARLPDGGEAPISRADILDRNGVVLATSLKVASVYANPSLVSHPQKAAAAIARVLPDLKKAELEEKLASGKRFTWIKRGLTPAEQYEVNRLGIPGVYFVDEERRAYPEGKTYAHVVGYVDIDNHGLSGVEQAFDKELGSKDAKPIHLSLDTRVQHVVRDELLKGIAEFSAIGAAGVVVDVTTGEVLSMVSLPDFDPHEAGKAEDVAKFNRITQGVYEMGSTFKSFTVAMALDSNKVSMRDGYDASSPIRVARYVIRDSHPKNRWLSVPEIFMYSSNIGTVKMAMDVGTKGQQEFLGRLGMLAPVNIELADRASPLVPNPWREISTMTVSFGHGISVTPLHLARGIAALVGDGVMRPLTLMKGGNPARKDEAVRVVSEATARNMRRLLRLVVKHGTGGKAEAAGYIVGGKTGTAEKAGAGGYDQNRSLTSFVSAFPMHAPKYVVLVMLDEPKPTAKTFGYATAGWTAAPVTGRVIARLAAVLGLPPTDPDAEDVQRALDIEYQISPSRGGYRDASVKELQRKGIRVASY